MIPINISQEINQTLSEHLNMGLDIFDQLHVVLLVAFSMAIPYLI